MLAREITVVLATTKKESENHSVYADIKDAAWKFITVSDVLKSTFYVRFEDTRVCFYYKDCWWILLNIKQHYKRLTESMLSNNMNSSQVFLLSNQNIW